VEVRRLSAGDEAALEEVLDAEPVVNLFLRGFLSVQPMDAGYWYGVQRGDRLGGVLLLLPDRLTVPWAPDPDQARALGAWLARRHRPTMLVGPRADCDHIWSTWAPGRRPSRFYDQRLYTAERPPPGPAPRGLRRARTSDWTLLVERSARMEYEDLGRDPYKEDPELHARVVKDRIAAGKTWVLERDGHVVFQLNIGTVTPDGVQVGGTYVPPRFRGQGLSTQGMAAMLHVLLRHHRRVTLHVNEMNTPAVRCYERVGFEPYAPYRLLRV